MENNNLDPILQNIEAIDKIIIGSVNNIIRELALDPDNEFLKRIANELLDARLLLANNAVQTVTCVTPKDKGKIKFYRDQFKMKNEENKNKGKEMDESERIRSVF
ncbi:MAG: hypothetical protein HFJ02_03955 [Bacilli bacterium]|jgi:hypothetical protein|nr:hypothetical protein [Bacilli bacterium]